MFSSAEKTFSTGYFRELDCISAQSINVNLKVKKDGTFLLEDYMPEQENTDNTETTVTETTVTALPFGFKLSNHLPDIYISNYNISFVITLNIKYSETVRTIFSLYMLSIFYLKYC